MFAEARWRRPGAAVLGVGAVVALWLVLLSALVVRFRDESVDDVFITYRYAQNLAEGHGLVYNPGERVFGTTAPGWALALGLGAAASGLPVAALGAVGTALGLLGIALLLVVGNPRRRPEALLAGSLVVSCFLVWIMAGSEIPVALAVLGLAAALAARRPGLAGAVAGFAVWCRPEAGLGVALLGLVLWRERRRCPWRYGVSAAAAILAGLAAAHLWFGSFLPATLLAKRLQTRWLPETWEGGAAFWPAALRQWETLYSLEATGPLVLLGLAGQVPLLAHGGRATRLLSLYGLATAVAYPLLGVGFYPWYVLPPVLSLLLGVAFLAGSLARSVHAYLGRTRPAAAAAGLTLAAVVWGTALSVPACRVRLSFEIRNRPHLDLYREVGRWLRTHTSPGEAVAYVEVGALAYYGRRPIRDLLGLVSPESLPYVAAGDMEGAYLVRPTPLVLFDNHLAGFMAPVCRAPWFASAFAEVARFERPDSGERLVVYRRRRGAELPPPRPPSRIDSAP